MLIPPCTVILILLVTTRIGFTFIGTSQLNRRLRMTSVSLSAATNKTSRIRLRMIVLSQISTRFRADISKTGCFAEVENSKLIRRVRIYIARYTIIYENLSKQSASRIRYRHTSWPSCAKFTRHHYISVVAQNPTYLAYVKRKKKPHELKSWHIRRQIFIHRRNPNEFLVLHKYLTTNLIFDFAFQTTHHR